jgi:hypothetical protein
MKEANVAEAWILRSGSDLMLLIFLLYSLSSGALTCQARLLESLVRLTEARARVDLRQIATTDDAKVGC